MKPNRIMCIIPAGIVAGIFMFSSCLQAILWHQLREAFCRDRGLEFYAVNRDYPEEEKGRNNHYSRKLKADLFIDDRNLGGLPDWGTIYGMIHDGTTFSDLIRNAGESPVSENHGRGLFSRLFGR